MSPVARSLTTPVRLPWWPTRRLLAACAVAMGLLLGAPLFGADDAAASGSWQKQLAPINTRWADEVDPQATLPEYPRPHLVREQWTNLNGLWDYAITPKDQTEAPREWQGQILVPFCAESALSGVMKTVGPEQRLWYRRKFATPELAENVLLLHFGAVDWEARAWVNGREVGSHRGGFDPFTFDITKAVQRDAENELIVSVWDPSDRGPQPRGKQVERPEGIWYTPVTGIWQTVWLEVVPRKYITSLKLVPDVDHQRLLVTAEAYDAVTGNLITGNGPNAPVVEVTLFDGETQVAQVTAHPSSTIAFPLDSPKLWSPTNPFLYGLKVRLIDAGHVVDKVDSYAALRKTSLGKDKSGKTRLLLNNEFVFQFGPLDQGWWPDGLYTAPTDEALRYDIEQTKRYGFNLIRKHVKVEPARWYYWCDRLGILVWQDMPSGDRGPAWSPNGEHAGEEVVRSPESAEIYRTEWKAIIDALQMHPCIIMWVPFNEAWGQFDTVGVTNWTKEYDPTRLVNCASGGNDFPVGDVIDLHRYPGPAGLEPTDDRASVLGEYGGLGLPISGHTWQNEANWGYRSFTSQHALTQAYLDMLEPLRALIDEPGLSAAIYTQTTDVEVEVNGLMTYDRALEKLPVDELAQAHQQLWQPAPKLTEVLPTAEKAAATWRWTTEAPASDWSEVAFNDQSWKLGPAGFGDPTTPGSVVRTEWRTDDIWMRRIFEVQQPLPGTLRLRIHHDEDVEVYLNGQLIKHLTGYTTGYVNVRLDEAATGRLVSGTNTLAVHCHQTGGGQYIDVGLVGVEAPEAK